MFLRQLSYLIALDKYRHFSRAAEHCGVSQPALSAGIRQLESELGITIINRNRRFNGLTEEGQRVLAWARQTVSDLSNLRQEAAFAQDVAGGSIAIGIMPPTMQVIPLLIESLRASIPALHVSITVCSSAEILHQLREHQIQLGLMYLDQIPSEGPFDTHALYQEQHVLAAGEGITLPHTRHCSWEAIGQLPLGLLNPQMRSRQFIDAAFREAGVRPHIMLETNALELLHTEVLASRLATILPVAALPERSSILQTRLLENLPTPDVGVVRLQQTIMPTLSMRAWEILQKLDFHHSYSI
ncbi:LysR substrate-binding domain-containing protein [Acetobacter oryzoeni]|uniref:LysR family transcriptional regulator n=1 Tax=Acetobacter oryzoeni TaxID=2500548 RepID=A0A5B9GI44_9PROT|nr:LysR substrate-binding domain-containing protein [Acetobacter oryzoeni]MCP1202221.1 LysR substrate-binding domain-containing protein [Acetobacter oryzoeni]QEE85951.1 LysR family transcriptional regulator [Acetobacter oryzoeni]